MENKLRAGQIVQQLKSLAFLEDLSSHHPRGGLQLSNSSSRRSGARFWHPHGPDMKKIHLHCLKNIPNRIT